MPEELNNPGVLLDTRPEVEKEKDYKFAEIVAAVEPVDWIEKPQSDWRKFPIANQNGSGSCVAQTLRKLYSIYIFLKTGVWVSLSASHIYQRRANRPAAGMSGTDAFEIARRGTTLEQFVASENMTDSQMDSAKVLPFMEEVGKIFKIGNYTVVSPTDIDTVASIIQKTGKGVMVWFYFQGNEWTNVPTVLNPGLSLNAPSTLRHSVTAVDYTLYQGKKALIIDDSWGLVAAMQGQRVITEDFFSKRNWFAAHFQNFAFEQVDDKPHYTFNRDLKFSTIVVPGDPDVMALQDILKWEQLFPSNVASSGYYGALTAKAVLAFRAKYNISSASDPLGRSVGPLTREKLNQLYSN